MDANGNTKRRYENVMPVTYEGWWESVLAEEKRYSTHVSHTRVRVLHVGPVHQRMGLSLQTDS